MGRGPKRIAHWEHWSCPDAETYLSGIDYYQQPRRCRQRMRELYPELDLRIPRDDTPIPPPRLGEADGPSSNPVDYTVRWGDAETGTFRHGEAFFHSPEDVFAFSPLEKGDFSDWPHVVMNLDFREEQTIYEHYRKELPPEWGDQAPEDSTESVWFYNTMFMWPLLTFGWELFLECCLDPRFERVMNEFAEINRRLFRALARLPVNFVLCHDDIVTSRGPVCSPDWMHTYIFPRYEEFFSLLRAEGKEILFMVDGCVDRYVDDIMVCGARGIISEPFTDYKAIAKRYPDPVIAGEGDNRILSRNDPKEIKKMVVSMAETGKMSGGYMMCIGNHIPWNTPPEAIKCYFDYSRELAFR